MGKSRLQMRREVEAAEAESKPAKATKKKATRKKAATRRTREKPPERKRAVWVLYSSSMKEEGRFPYDQKEAAEARLEVLLGRGKKIYFMQMVKELISGEAPVASDTKDEAKAKAKKPDEEEEGEAPAETGTEDAEFDADVEEEDDDAEESDEEE